LTPEDLRSSGTTVSRFTSKPEDVVLADVKPSDYIKRGSAGVVGSMMLLKSNQRMHAPFTQVSLKKFGLLDNLITFFLVVLIIFSKNFKNMTVHPFLVIIVGCTTHDRRHA
jgi:hypothetical protein